MLPGISTEQLRSRLNRMVADGLLTRQRYREVPPRVDYELTERARDLMPVLGALARWGYDWAWSPPRDGEEVDVGAILRLVPGLVRPPKSLRGTIAVSATAKRATPRDYLLRVSGGRVEIEEAEDPSADARVTGAHEAWIAALQPDGDRSGLKVTGNQKLANAVLDALAAPAARGTKAA